MSIPRRVWLVRHGQTDWNAAGRYQGITDRPLTEYGLRQARALGEYFAGRKIDAVIHSGLGRTESVARAIVGLHRIPCLIDQAWREASHGMWEGLTYSEVAQQYPHEVAARLADPLHRAPTGGECLADLAERIMAAWRGLGRAHAGQRIVVVTHAAPIQVVLCTLTGVPLSDHWRWRIDLGSVTAIDCYAGVTILRAVNVVPPIKR
ncbi:MAG: histidine phosphatase family protein [Anaerolineae bacterium]|nr:histidine phosphatase family protein [Thermoflexales bacterium]MDW8406650.1 histidine phosphatase family protein [Anaerolineae bacterium]